MHPFSSPPSFVPSFVVVLSLKYICALASNELLPVHCEAVATLPQFLYLLLKFSSTPSLWISIQTFTIWRNLLVNLPSPDSRLLLPPDALGALLALSVDRLIDFEDLLSAPEYAGYAAFLREDFDELDAVGSGGIFRNFLNGVKRVLMEIVEGIVGRECFGALEFLRERLRRFIEVDRFNEQGRDGTIIPTPSPFPVEDIGGGEISLV